MKQLVLHAFTIIDMKNELKAAINMGWKVKILEANEDGWIAVLES